MSVEVLESLASIAIDANTAKSSTTVSGDRFPLSLAQHVGFRKWFAKQNAFAPIDDMKWAASSQDLQRAGQLTIADKERFADIYRALHKAGVITTPYDRLFRLTVNGLLEKDVFLSAKIRTSAQLKVVETHFPQDERFAGKNKYVKSMLESFQVVASEVNTLLRRVSSATGVLAFRFGPRLG